jgi:hypothetical protein
MGSLKPILAALLVLTGLGMFVGAYVATFDRNNTYGMIMLGILAVFAGGQMITKLLGFNWRDSGKADSGIDLDSGDGDGGD